MHDAPISLTNKSTLTSYWNVDVIESHQNLLYQDTLRVWIKIVIFVYSLEPILSIFPQVTL